MKYCIVQLDYYKDRNTKKYSIFKNVFQPSVERYAKKYKIDYKIITYQADYFPHHAEKVKIFKDIVLNYTEYNNVLFLDLDVFVTSCSPNIFDSIECQHIAGCIASYERLLFGINLTQHKLQNSNNNLSALGSRTVRPNSGVVLFNLTKIPKQAFHANEEDILEDEMFLAYKFAYRNLCYQIIPYQWNHRDLFSLDNAYFIHALSNLFDDNGMDSKRNIHLEDVVNRIHSVY